MNNLIPVRYYENAQSFFLIIGVLKGRAYLEGEARTHR